VVREPATARRLIGPAGQNAAVDPALTGRENLEIVGRLDRLSGREARRRAGEVLRRHPADTQQLEEAGRAISACNWSARC
jgi:ABC-2 type transport system ATP-binding protein